VVISPVQTLPHAYSSLSPGRVCLPWIATRCLYITLDSSRHICKTCLRPGGRDLHCLMCSGLYFLHPLSASQSDPLLPCHSRPRRPRPVSWQRLQLIVWIYHSLRIAICMLLGLEVLLSPGVIFAVFVDGQVLRGQLNRGWLSAKHFRLGKATSKAR